MGQVVPDQGRGGRAMKRTGGCLCGAVRYEAEGEQKMSFLCHCRDCQRQSGSGNLPFLIVGKDGFRVSGDTWNFEKTGDSGRWMRRHFCPSCGSTLFAHAEALPDAVMIFAGTLDDTAQYNPDRSVHSASMAHWDHLVGDKA